ncbi:MAG: beta-lactamase-like protein [Acidobacteria bacterium OLB17]|nr:MAG: beta-lactamase-like protein [Acidobacteria bacterium OLB17]
MEEIEYETVRERKRLAYGGAASLVVTIDKKTHDLIGEPLLDFQGVAGVELGDGFESDAREAVSDAISEMKREHIADRTVFREQLRLALKNYLRSELGTKPVIVTTIVEV